MSNELFDEFDSVSAKQWKQKIQFDLKGADYNKTLLWNTNEDIAVKPFYHADDFEELLEPTSKKAQTWKICQSIFVTNAEKSNLKAIDAIERGAESIIFIINSEDTQVENLVRNINLDVINIHFKIQFLSEKFIQKLSNIPKFSKINIENDIIGNLARNGNFYFNLKQDFNVFKFITNQTNSFSIDGTLYQNAGANIVQQLGYLMAHANAYLYHFSDNLSTDLKVKFNVSIGPNYFFEIAKIRALRLLWKALAGKYHLSPECHVMATPSKRNKTLYEYNNNMLRTTTEYMSAILGGADTVCCLSHDAIYHKDNEFSERIARNQLLVLKHESYFDKVDNPADGAYYIETLTNQLAEKALILFKDIEKNGGFLKQLKQSTIQRKTKESALKEQKQFDSGETVLLGTNKHINPNDFMKHELEIYPFVKINQRKTLIEPIIEKRLSETFEQKRLKNEK